MYSLVYVLWSWLVSSSSQSIPQKKARDWSRGAFDQTEKLLDLNPEFYTIWNYRRNIMLNGIFSQRSVAFAHLVRQRADQLSVLPKTSLIYSLMNCQ